MCRVPLLKRTLSLVGAILVQRVVSPIIATYIPSAVTLAAFASGCRAAGRGTAFVMAGAWVVSAIQYYVSVNKQGKTPENGKTKTSRRFSAPNLRHYCIENKLRWAAMGY